MGMLLDTRNESIYPNGFNPRVQNGIIEAKATKAAKFFWNFLFVLGWLTIIPGIIMTSKMVAKKNNFQRWQNDINESASNIDINLTKRAELLTKLFDVAKGYMKFEGDVMKQVAALRSGVFRSMSVNEKQDLIAHVSDGINLQFENYPDLKAIDAIRNLQRQSTVCENEIAAARTIYNRQANEFNRNLSTWPNVVFADSMKLYSLPLYEASPTQRRDVNLSFDSPSRGTGSEVTVK